MGPIFNWFSSGSSQNEEPPKNPPEAAHHPAGPNSVESKTERSKGGILNERCESIRNINRAIKKANKSLDQTEAEKQELAYILGEEFRKKHEGK